MYQFQVALRCDETLLVSSVAQERDEAIGRLSRSEREVMDLVLEGCSNRDIAERRGTSLHTVANQLKAVFRKFGCSGRSELAARVAGAPSLMKGAE